VSGKVGVYLCDPVFIVAGRVHLPFHRGRGADQNISIAVVVSDASLRPHHDPVGEYRSQVMEKLHGDF
jgi:hypothetical protein